MASHVRSLHGLQRDGMRVGLVALAYFAAHQVAFLFPDAGQVLAVVWPAGGIGLAALLLNDRRLWLPILAGMFAAGNLANWMVGRPLFNSLGFMTANVLESLACARVIAAWCGERVTFTRVKEMLALIFAATAVNAGTALVGAGTAWLASRAPFGDFWATWWVSDGLGILIVAPLIVAWLGPRTPAVVSGRARLFESAAFLALWCAVSWLTFQNWTDGGVFIPQPYLLVALLAYAALRFSLRGVTLAIAAMSVILISSPAVTAGPLFWGAETLEQRLLQAQAFIASLTATGYLLNATLAERRRAEAALRLSDANYRQAITAAGAVPYHRDYRGEKQAYAFMGEGILALTGYSAAEITPAIFDQLEQECIMRGSLAHLSPDEAGRLSEAGKIQHWSCDYRILTRDGRTRWVSDSAVQVRDEHNRRLGVIGILQDITDRKQAEAALRESEKRYQNFIAHSFDGIYRTEFDHPIDTTLPVETQIDLIYENAYMAECNDALARMYNLPSAESFLGARLIDAHGGKDNPVNRAAFRKLIENGYKSFNDETVEYDADGEPIWFLSNTVGTVEAGFLVRLWGTAANITERKQAEAQIKQALAEKETLLRELYHRTKNNMGAISAMLELQADYHDDPRLREAFRDAQSRIRSMALVHQKLYEVQDLSRINLREYIHDLAALLRASYSLSSAGPAMSLELEDVPVLIDTAIPCGLILNELISNALKYAFPAGRPGEVKIRLRRMENGQIELIVADDGVGVPEGFNFRRDGRLGLQNVFVIGENQLRGRVAFTANPGVRCQVIFADDLYTPRV